MDIHQYQKWKEYETWPQWKQFLHAWSLCFKTANSPRMFFRAMAYPYFYLLLWWIARKVIKKNENHRKN